MTDENTGPSWRISRCIAASTIATPTKGVVTRGNHSGKVIIDFHIEVPALDNYRYQLARVLHDVVLYPAVIQQNGITAAECRSEHAFKEALKSIFASEGTSRIVQSLLAQARDGTGVEAAEPGAA